MAIGLFQCVSFASMSGQYSKSLERRDYGNKPNRFAIPRLVCIRVFISLLLVPGALRNLYILHLYVLILLIRFLLVFFSHDLLIVIIAKAFLF